MTTSNSVNVALNRCSDRRIWEADRFGLLGTPSLQVVWGFFSRQVEPFVQFAVKQHVKVFRFQPPDVMLNLAVITTVIRVITRMCSPLVLA